MTGVLIGALAVVYLVLAVVTARWKDKLGNKAPVTVDNALLAPGEIAVFDAQGELLVWFPAPGAGPPYEAVCRKDTTILTYEDMPSAAPGLREQLRVLKGGRDEH